LPYLSLSGTSMAAPVVTGTVALMLQANPSLTPNLVKAILQYTARVYPQYDALTQGAGYLNARGAVELAQFLAAPTTATYPMSTGGSRRIIWGNYLVTGGTLTADANAWAIDTEWGSTSTTIGDFIRWGVACAGDACTPGVGTWDWVTGVLANVVWGSACNGADCGVPWVASQLTTTADEGDTVVWGTSDEGDTVVWGTSCTNSSCQTLWGQ